MIVKIKNKNNEINEATVSNAFFKTALNKSIIYMPLLLNMIGLYTLAIDIRKLNIVLPINVKSNVRYEKLLIFKKR
jgi:hypothetical protein